MKPVTHNGSDFYGELNGAPYLIEDELAEKFFVIWKNNSAEEVVKNVLQSTSLWDDDLSTLPGFQKAVTDDLNKHYGNGMMKVLEMNSLNSPKMLAGKCKNRN